MKLITLLCSTIFALVLASSMGAALAAAPLGNHAFVAADATTYQGPGTQYAPGATLNKGQEVTVTRCAERWCLLASPHTWVSIDQLSFGQHARGAFTGPHFEDFRGGDGTVCLHAGRNFSGESICVSSGNVANDLALLGWDNRISSVSVAQGTSVQLCRDRDLGSHCQLITADTDRLNWLLDNAASSFHVLTPSPY